MAKTNKKNIGVAADLEPEKANKAQILFYWVLIPLLFTFTVLLIFAQIMNVNVFEKAAQLTEKLPFSSENKQDDEAPVDLRLEERVVTLQAQIEEKEAEISSIQSKLEETSSENERLLIEQERLMDEIAVLQRQNEATRLEFEEIVKTFENMSAKSAAPILTNMSETEALRILTSMKPDVLADILEKMPPEEAAKYSELMSAR